MPVPSIDILTVVCGKQGVLNQWAKFLFTAGNSVLNVNLKIVDNSNNVVFRRILISALKLNNVYSAFNDVQIIECNTGVPSLFETAREGVNAQKKHQSTADAFTEGFRQCNADYIFTVDDDVICPSHIVASFSQKISEDPSIGCVTGYYFTNPNWSHNPEKADPRETSVAKDMDSRSLSGIYEIWGEPNCKIRHCGTGCALWRASDVKQCLPLRVESPTDSDLFFLGPDVCLCDDINKLGKSIILDTKMICQHLDHNGTEVGLGVKNFFEEYQNQTQRMSQAEIAYYLQVKLNNLNSLMLKSITELIEAKPTSIALQHKIKADLENLFEKSQDPDRQKIIKNIIKYILITDN